MLSVEVGQNETSKPGHTTMRKHEGLTPQLWPMAIWPYLTHLMVVLVSRTHPTPQLRFRRRNLKCQMIILTYTNIYNWITHIYIYIIEICTCTIGNNILEYLLCTMMLHLDAYHVIWCNLYLYTHRLIFSYHVWFVPLEPIPGVVAFGAGDGRCGLGWKGSKIDDSTESSESFRI